MFSLLGKERTSGEKSLLSVHLNIVLKRSFLCDRLKSSSGMKFNYRYSLFRNENRNKERKDLLQKLATLTYHIIKFLSHTHTHTLVLVFYVSFNTTLSSFI